jgi:hypothetical protein
VGRILQRYTPQPDGTVTRSFVENMRQVKSGLMRGTDKSRDVLTVDPTPHAGQAGPPRVRKPG